MDVTPEDRALLAALSDGLPLEPEPFAALGRRLGLAEAEVLQRLRALVERGVVRRFGVVVRHHELGYRANAMVVWDVPDGAGRAVVYAVAAIGWLTVLVATFLINHFDLFGLRQSWLAFSGRPYTGLAFRTPGPYRLVRHPLYVGWLLAFWAAPTMTASHLVFAAGATAYILLAIPWEERDLVAAHPEYEEYRRRVPMLVPRVRAHEERSPHAAGIP